MSLSCPCCGCVHPHPAHPLLAALAADDLDLALRQGLLDAQPCPGCSASCNARMIAARDTRRAALAARDRYRARTARLARLKQEREAARQPEPAAPAQTAPALPGAAADALARALARAKARHP